MSATIACTISTWRSRGVARARVPRDVVSQHGTDVASGNARAVAEQPKLLDQPAGREAGDRDRQRDRRHCEEELAEFPLGLLGDQQVLRLADLRHDAADRGADRAVHHQPAQERAELLEVRAMQLGHVLRRAPRRARRRSALAGGDAVIHLVEAERRP